jgi:hypothetical protein
VETANNNAVGAELGETGSRKRPVATWIRDTLQNGISTEYLRGYNRRTVPVCGREEPKRKCKVGDVFEIEGYVGVVVETDGVEVMFQMMDTEGGGLDSNDEGEVGREEEVVQLIMETEGSVLGYRM